MSGLNKNRRRNKTVCFRVSPEEDQLLASRIKVSGLPKAEYIIESLLKNGVTIAVGKYQSDRLSLEIKRMRESFEERVINTDGELVEEMLRECKSLLLELQRVVSVNCELITREKRNDEIAKK